MTAIENFDDPVYYLNTNGKVTNKVVKTPYNFDSVSNLTLHLADSYYINNRCAGIHFSAGLFMAISER